MIKVQINKQGDYESVFQVIGTTRSNNGTKIEVKAFVFANNKDQATDILNEFKLYRPFYFDMRTMRSVIGMLENVHKYSLTINSVEVQDYIRQTSQSR